MSTWAGIDELHLSPARPAGPLPAVPLRMLNTIRELGPIEPVVVRTLGPHRFEILSNVETWLAVQRLGGNKVPIEVRAAVDDEEAAAIVGLSYQVRQQDPLDEAESLQQQLKALGGRSKRGAIRRLAERTGLSRTYVSHALRLLELPAPVQAMIRDGRLHAGHAKPLVAIKSRQAQLQLARMIARDRSSVRAAEALARRVRAGQLLVVDERLRRADPDIIRLQARVSELVGCDVHVDTEEGKLVIDYARDLDILGGLLQRLGYVEG